MAAKKSSALTAALSGAPGESAPAHHHHAPKKSLLDPAAFPCLAYAAEVEGIESVPEGDSPDEDLGLAKFEDHLGSVPVDFPVGSNLVRVYASDYVLPTKAQGRGRACKTNSRLAGRL